MKKSLSINQLLLRMFIVVLFAVFATRIAYLFLIERPGIEKSLSLLIQSDLDDIKSDAKRNTHLLEQLNYQYAVSNDTFNFIQTPNQNFIKQVIPDEIFYKLKINGMLFFNEELQLIFQKGLYQKTGSVIHFELDNFTKYPQNIALFKADTEETKFNTVSGVIETVAGPAMFSSKQVRKSIELGINEGYLLFIKLIDQDYLDEISKDTNTLMSLSMLDSESKLAGMLDEEVNEFSDQLLAVNKRILRDFTGKPLAVLTIRHTDRSMPSWFDFRILIYICLLTMLLFLFKFMINKYIRKPIEHLSTKVKMMDENVSFSHLDEDSYISELNDFSSNFNKLAFTVEERNQLLTRQASIDPLTNIANRRAFDQHLDSQINLYTRHNIGFCLIMADIDHFKGYNDNLGHQAGDEALKKVAHTLNSFFKRENDICARFGGEEFIMLFSDVSEAFVNERLSEILLAITALQINHPDSSINDFLTISLGGAVVSTPKNNQNDLTAETIIQVADKALYSAKNMGRNRACIANV